MYMDEPQLEFVFLLRVVMMMNAFLFPLVCIYAFGDYCYGSSERLLTKIHSSLLLFHMLHWFSMFRLTDNNPVSHPNPKQS